MRARTTLAQVARELDGRASVQLFSSTRKEGVAETEARVGAWIARWGKEKPLAEGETSQGQNALNEV